ncbi:MAG: hypothetical protein K0Q79_2033 [Flavipsychrobacter sp.]|nr:hypothetical protein [Flavipsychrobacter sp.]
MLQAGFIILTVVLAIVLFVYSVNVVSKAYSADKRKRFLFKAALVIFGWLAYVTFISLTGIFTDTSLPPRIPLLLVLPTFLFFIYFFRNRHFKPLIAQTPATWPVYFQSFRIFVELLIWQAYLNDILPKEASFEGYNFDVMIGITAPLVGYFLFRNGVPKSKSLIILWNIAGFITLAIVVSILISQAYFYSIWGLTESAVNKGFGLFPYTLLAGFLMPAAMFMHIFSLVKTKSLAQ